jgi:hypothetical protein
MDGSSSVNFSTGCLPIVLFNSPYAVARDLSRGFRRHECRATSKLRKVSYLILHFINFAIMLPGISKETPASKKSFFRNSEIKPRLEK